MIIDRILNNNVVIIKDQNGKEQVVCGKGIAFKKRNGDSIDDSAVNKVFVLKDEKEQARFIEVASHIPLEYIELTDEIVAMIKLESGSKISDHIYVSLTDHIYMAIQRFKEGLSLTNFMLWDTKRFYEDDYKLALKALDLIEKRMNLRLPEDEAGFIALHIVNAKMDGSEMKDTIEMTKLMHEVANIVKRHFQVEFDYESVYYYRFITHLKFFAKRLLTHQTIEEHSDDDLLEVVKVKYASSYACVQRIQSFISHQYQYELSSEEQLYLTIHIERVIYKNKSKN